jgi:hypothetical protein
MLIQTIANPMTLHAAAKDRVTIVTRVTGETVNEPSFNYNDARLDVGQFLGLPGVQFTVLPGAKPLALTFTFSSAQGSSYQLSELLGQPPQLIQLQPIFPQTLPTGVPAGELVIFTVIGQ